MSLTRIGSIGINTGIAFAGVTTIVTLNTANDALSIGATVNVGSGITLGASGDIFATGVSTVTTLKVGSGVTVSSDGDGFFTGIVTATSFSGSGTNLTGIDTDLVSDTSPQLGGNLDTNDKNIVFGDSSGATVNRLTFGAGNDLSLFHDSNRSAINNSTGELRILSGSDITIGKRSAADSSYSAQLATFKIDGAVELYYDDSKKLETTSAGATVTGDLTVGTAQILSNGNILLADNDKIKIGTGEDLQIYHDGSNSYIDNITGDFYIRGVDEKYLYIQAKSGENSIVCKDDGAVELYHNNSQKFATTASGIDVTGNCTITGNFRGNDNVKLNLGNGDDLQIYHDGNDSYIDDAGVGSLLIRTTTNSNVSIKSSSAFMAKFMTGDAVELYHNNEKKLFTTANGVDVQAEGSAVELRLKTDGGTLRGYVYGNNSNEFGFLSSAGNWPFKHTLNSKSEFYIGSNLKATIDSDGLKFGTDTAAANALHDYEEGTWDVTSFNYDYDGNQAQRGHYVKVGRVVHAFFRIKFHNQSTYVGQHLRFTGLPFTAASGNPYDVNVGGFAQGYATIDFFRIYVAPNSTYAYWYTAAGNNFNNGTSLNSADVRGCITYTASA